MSADGANHARHLMSIGFWFAMVWMAYIYTFVTADDRHRPLLLATPHMVYSATYDDAVCGKEVTSIQAAVYHVAYMLMLSMLPLLQDKHT